MGAKLPDVETRDISQVPIDTAVEKSLVRRLDLVLLPTLGISSISLPFLYY